VNFRASHQRLQQNRAWQCHNRRSPMGAVPHRRRRMMTNGRGPSSYTELSRVVGQFEYHVGKNSFPSKLSLAANAIDHH